jgi:superfamily II DNA/RNA helicase
VAEVLTPLAAAVGLSTMTVFGGVPFGRQIRSLEAGIDLVVACPGRLEDLIARGHAHLDDVQITVLDEADHMADLGFLPAVRRLLDATDAGGQRLLFSATLDRGVDALVKRYLTEPAIHHVDSEHSPVSKMAHHVLHVGRDHRIDVVADLALSPGRTVVFTRTKRGAKNLTRQLKARGVAAVELHGDLGQGARTRNLAAFAGGRADALVATDIAARGIHVDDVALVVHADPPLEHKAYLHRSGRTARAGESGTVVTVMLDDQVQAVRALMRKAGIKAEPRRAALGDPVLQTIAPGQRTVRSVERPEPSRPETTRTTEKKGTRRTSRHRSGPRKAAGAPTASRSHSPAAFSAAGARGRS